MGRSTLGNAAAETILVPAAFALGPGRLHRTDTAVLLPVHRGRPAVARKPFCRLGVCVPDAAARQLPLWPRERFTRDSCDRALMIDPGVSAPAARRGALVAFLRSVLTPEEQEILRGELTRGDRLPMLKATRSLLRTRAQRLVQLDIDALDVALQELLAQPAGPAAAASD